MRRRVDWARVRRAGVPGVEVSARTCCGGGEPYVQIDESVEDHNVQILFALQERLGDPAEAFTLEGLRQLVQEEARLLRSGGRFPEGFCDGFPEALVRFWEDLCTPHRRRAWACCCVVGRGGWL